MERFITILEAGGETRRISLGERFVMGSSSDCDLVVLESGIGPTHLTLTPTPSGALLQVSEASVAGVLLNGHQVSGELRIHNNDQIETGRFTLTLDFEETWREQWSSSPVNPEVGLRSLYRLLKLTNTAEEETVFLQDVLPVLADGVQAECATVVVQSRGGRIQRLRTVGDTTIVEENWFEAGLETVGDVESKRIFSDGAIPLLFVSVRVPDWLDVALCFARRRGAKAFETQDEDLGLIVCRQASATIRRLRLAREALMLEQRVLEIEETEQRRIGQDLHDGLCQDLIGIGFLTAHLHRSLEESQSSLTPEAEKIKQLLSKATERARGLARGLSPVALEEEYGLTSALRELAEGAEDVFGIASTFVCRTPVPVRDSQVAGNLYFLAREAVINAAKHSNGKHVRVELSEDHERIKIAVTDNGVGLPPDPHGGLGLKLMQHRAKTIGAQLSFDSPPDGGLRVRCTWTKAQGDTSMERHVLCSEALNNPAYLGRGGLYRIGRDRAADVRVRSHKVSRYHAEIRWDGHGFVVTDVGSTNGTLVDTTPVEGPTPLRDGSIISLGGCEVLYRVLPPGEDGEFLKEGTQQIDPSKFHLSRKGSSTRSTEVHSVETSRNLEKFRPPPGGLSKG